MIRIYNQDADEAEIRASNGLGVLMPESCVVEEVVNGLFDLTMKHPIDSGEKWKYLDEDRIVTVPTHWGTEQPFRIYSIDATAIPGYIVVSAKHIFFDLASNFIEDTRPTGATGDMAGNQILAGLQFATDFTFDSDITSVNTAYYIRKNPLTAFLGTDPQSFVNRWGGEIIRNWWNISINTRIGSDKGYSIKYRKNLTGLRVVKNTEKRFTRIMPLATGEDGEVLMLPEKYVDSPLMANYPNPIIGSVSYSDIKVMQETNGVILYPDEASAFDEMRARVALIYANAQDESSYTLEVDFLLLQQTDEYKNISPLFAVELGDDVSVLFEPLEVSEKLRVVSCRYDCIQQRYIRIVLGQEIDSLMSSLSTIQASVRDLDVSIIQISNRLNVWVGTELPAEAQYLDLFVDTDDTSRYDVLKMASGATITYDHEVFVINASAALTITLPVTTADEKATGCVGTIMRFLNRGSSIATIETPGGETINGEASIKLYPNESIELIVLAVGEWVA